MLAYNPTTHKMELEPILHVWIHKDSDLVDLTITTNIHAPHSTKVTKTQEVLHTKHITKSSTSGISSQLWTMICKVCFVIPQL